MKNNNESIKVGIILPSFNSFKSIDRAIQSVINQSYSNWVLYIVDDCSNDGSYNYIIENFHDERINIIRNEVNCGVAQTRNRGVDLAKECLISFIDSDDEWARDKLEVQVKYYQKGYSIIASSYNYIKPSGRVYKISPKNNILSQLSFLKKKYRICFSSILIKNTDNIRFHDIGHEDFYYLYQHMSSGNIIYVIDYPLVNYYESEGSLSSNKVKAAGWHYKILNSIYKAKIKKIYFFGWYIWSALVFKIKVKG